MDIQLAAQTVTRVLLERFHTTRKRSVSLTENLSEEDCCVQSMPDASPIKWHLAHTTWFFETFILEKLEADFRPHHQAFRVLFNSYYNGIGDKHPRAQRGLLTRPSTDEVIAYRHNVDGRISRLLERAIAQGGHAELAALIELGIQHEQQHQELMLTDIKHLLSMNPLFPAYAEGAPAITHSARVPELSWIPVEAGVVEIGYTGNAFFFDNESPRHRQFVEAFSLASRLVTNAEYLAFIEDGSYRNPSLWLSEGWDWLRTNHLTQPLYWHQADDGLWHEYTLYGLQRLQSAAPALHLSYFEAEAYARWAGLRLPTEFEWETVAAKHAINGDAPCLHPHPALQSGLTQLYGTAWQWTSSSYAPYPGFAPAAGAIGEYNGKFMVNQYVLRGSSCATPAGHARASYRNFFPASARWQVTGIRLAKSGDGAPAYL
jgi:ergothioneine biosynthesis protein EgtB